MNFSAKSCKICLISWKSTKTHRFGQNYATFSNKLPCFGVSMNFSAKGCKKWLNSWKSTRNHRSGQNFAAFRKTTMSSHFYELFRKKLQKVPHFVKKHEKSSIWPKLCNFSNKLPCLSISLNFSEKSCKKCLISWKNTKHHRFGKNLQFFEQTTMSLHFDQLFREKLQKVPHFVKKHEKSSIWPKLSTFRASYHVSAFSWTSQQEVAKSASFRGKAREIIDLAKTMQLFRTNYHVFAFRSTFQEKIAKSASFREKTQKTIDLAKTCNFSSKLPCLGIFMNFSERSCKKCLISWKSTRNHRFRQHYATFRTDYHVFAFRWIFKEKVAKSGSFREKARKIMDLVKTCNFSNKLPCFGVSMNFSTNSCRNCLISWKSTKTHRFGQNYATFSNKLPCFGVSMNFSAKGCKKWLNSWKSTRNHRSGQTFAAFRKTTMSLHFDELFRKKFQKVPHFVKKHEKPSIWSKLATFRTNYHVLVFRWTSRQTVAETASFREKARKLIDLAKTMQLFLTNYHVLVFRWTFQQKVAKSGSIREKAREIIDLAKPLQLFEKLPCLCISMNFSGKSCKKCLISWKSTKNHRSDQNFATFRTNYHVFPFRWTFQKKVAKSASFREKTRKIIDLAKTCNFSNKLPCLCISINFSGKSCKKCLISWKSTKNHRFGQNFQLFEQTTMSLHFHELLSKKLQKVPYSVEKHEKSSIWPKLCNFFEQTTMSLHFDQLFGKKLQKVAQFVKKDEISSIWQKLCNFSNNYHVFGFRSTFQEKVLKSASFRKKARKIIDLDKSL